MDFIELIYVFMGFIFVGLGTFLFGYTRWPESMARLKRAIFKKNYGIVTLRWKGSFTQRFVHDFNSTIFNYGRGETAKTFTIKKDDIDYEGTMPLCYFVEDDAASASLGMPEGWRSGHPESTSEYKVPPENLSSIIALIKNRAAAKAAMDKKNLFWLVIICIILSGLAMGVSFLAWNNTNEILKVLGVAPKGLSLDLAH